MIIYRSIHTGNSTDVPVSTSPSRNGARYVWDQSSDLPQLLSDGNTLYIPGVGQWNGTSWVYELTDGLGSVRQLSDAQGNIIQRYDYSPFGEVIAVEGQRSSALQYTGEQQDGDTGLVYLRARWYDAATGRFTSIDPFTGFDSLPQTQQPYTYVGNNSINLTDPSGKIAPLLLAAGIYAAGYFAYDFLDQHIPGPALNFIGMLTGYENIQQDAWKLSDPCKSTGCKILSLGDMALNSALGIATILGIGSGIKSIQAARAMQEMSIAERLSYLRGLAADVGTRVRPGSSFFRPLGSRFIWLHGGALDDVWRLAGGFFHELAHVGQEFGRWGRIARPLLRASAAVAGPTERNWARLALYLINPAEGQAFISGLASWENIGLFIGNQIFTRPILQGINSLVQMCK